MHIRPATRDDLADIATTVSRALMDDDISSWLMPDQKQHPERLRQRCLQMNTSRWNNGMYLWVAVLDKEDPEWVGTPTIVGYAAYEKEVGAPDDSSKRKWTLSLSLDRMLRTVEDNYYWYFRGCLGTNKQRLRILGNELQTNPQLQKFARSWEVSMLMVDPAFHRRGIGGKLLAWGKERAREDKAPLWLWASVKGRGLYAKEGFEKFGEVDFGPDLEPFPLMVWMPESLQ